MKFKKQTKFITQQFSDIEHQAAQDSGPWKKGNKRDEPSDCPGLLLGEVFHAGVKRGKPGGT